METLAGFISERIRAEGPIPFASFMEMALYYPGLGYYVSGKRRTGDSGDFYTSPQVHPVFAALLALQLERMWQLMGRPSHFQVIEAGAGEGRLARDIVEYSRCLDAGFRSALAYAAQDIRTDKFEASKRDASPLIIRYLHATGRSERGDRPPLRTVAGRELPFREVRGCILSNELLDAFPVHRLRVRGGELQEVYVDVRGDVFEEVLGDLSPLIAELLEDMEDMPAEGSRIEISPSAWAWMLEAGRALESGFVLTVDYGYGEATGQETLASYRAHSVSSPYLNVGAQDLTAHVDFGALAEAGRRAGLRVLGLTSQRRFLLHLGLGAFQEAAARLRLPQKQHEANQMAMLDLVRPDGLGSFGAMVQCKAVPGVRMNDLPPVRSARDRIELGELPVPLLGPQHLRLLESRYPHLDWEMQ